MRYEIQRGICDQLRVELEAGEAVITEVGKFIFARGAIDLSVALVSQPRRSGRRAPSRL